MEPWGDCSAGGLGESQPKHENMHIRRMRRKPVELKEGASYFVANKGINSTYKILK